MQSFVCCVSSGFGHCVYKHYDTRAESRMCFPLTPRISLHCRSLAHTRPCTPNATLLCVACLAGFGHRVYKYYDPRAKIMKEMCHRVLTELGVECVALFSERPLAAFNIFLPSRSPSPQLAHVRLQCDLEARKQKKGAQPCRINIRTRYPTTLVRSLNGDFPLARVISKPV